MHNHWMYMINGKHFGRFTFLPNIVGLKFKPQNFIFVMFGFNKVNFDLKTIIFNIFETFNENKTNHRKNEKSY